MDARAPVSPAAAGPARLLVRLPNWLGDLLLARPLLHALAAAFPRAERRAVGPAALLELLAGERLFDRLHAWPAAGRARAALARELAAWRPEAALALPPSFSSAWFLWRARCARRVGYRSEGRDLLLTTRLRRPARGDRHLSEEYLELGATLGAAPAPLPDLPVPEPARASAARLLEEVTAREPAGDGYAVLGPGASYGPAKRWGAERFAALGRALVARGRRVVALGTAAEAATCEAVARAIGPGAASLAGRTDLPALAALCAGAEAAVCNDSGLAHLSAAVGVPTVVVFGSTSSAWTAPLGRRVRVVQDAPVCSPCFRRTCRIGYRCLAAVGVEAVERALAEARGR